MATIEDSKDKLPFKRSVEGKEFLNAIIDKIWPFLDKYLNSEQVKDAVLKVSKNYIKLESIRLNDALVFHEITVLERKWLTVSSSESIVFDLDTEFKNVELHLKDATFGIAFGVKMFLRAQLRVVLNHLTSDFLPLFEACSLYFEFNPDIHFDFEDAAALLDIPFMKGVPEEIIKKILSDLMVYPNRMTIPVNDSVDISAYKYPPAYGVLRVNVTQMDNLSGKYEKWGNARFYYNLQSYYGSVKSSTEKAMSNETGFTQWDQIFDIVITEPDIEKLKVSIYEEDYLKDDEHVGDIRIADLSEIIFTPKNNSEPESTGEGGAVVKPKTTFDIDGDKTGQATILFQFIPFISTNLNGAIPLNTIGTSDKVVNKYYICCYVIKMDITDKKKTRRGKDDDISRTFVMHCSQNSAHINFYRQFKTSKSGEFELPLACEALLETLAPTLEFVFAEEEDDIKKSTFMKFSIDTTGFDQMEYTEPKEVKGQIDGAEVVTAVVRLAKFCD